MTLLNRPPGFFVDCSLRQTFRGTHKGSNPQIQVAHLSRWRTSCREEGCIKRQGCWFRIERDRKAQILIIERTQIQCEYRGIGHVEWKVSSSQAKQKVFDWYFAKVDQGGKGKQMGWLYMCVYMCDIDATCVWMIGYQGHFCRRSSRFTKAQAKIRISQRMDQITNPRHNCSSYPWSQAPWGIGSICQQRAKDRLTLDYIISTRNISLPTSSICTKKKWQNKILFDLQEINKGLRAMW